VGHCRQVLGYWLPQKLSQGGHTVTGALSDSAIAELVREVTDEEVAFYEEHGWVKLDGLVDPELAAELLEASGTEDNADLFVRNHLALESIEPFRSLMFSERMGWNAQRLLNRTRLSDADVRLRYHGDSVLCKLPGAEAVPYHQDSTEHCPDRPGEVRFWLALSEVTPEMGAMRFVTRSHREGPLGSISDGTGRDLLELYPRLVEVYELSPPFHYRPGDATVHHGYMIHGSGPNNTDQPRRSYLWTYVAADARYRDGQVENWGSKLSTLQDTRNPIVYPREKPA